MITSVLMDFVPWSLPQIMCTSSCLGLELHALCLCLLGICLKLCALDCAKGSQAMTILGTVLQNLPNKQVSKWFYHIVPNIFITWQPWAQSKAHNSRQISKRQRWKQGMKFEAKARRGVKQWRQDLEVTLLMSR